MSTLARHTYTDLEVDMLARLSRRPTPSPDDTQTNRALYGEAT